MKTVEQIEAELIAPGGPFEIIEEEVLGEKMKVFKDRDRSLREIFDKSTNHGDNEYIICGDRRITFNEHHALVHAVAHNLREKYGIQKGDRVAILADNHPEWIITFWATVCIGGIAVGLNGWWTREEILYSLEDCDPKLLVGDRKRLERIKDDNFDFPFICLEDEFDALAQGEGSMPEAEIAEDDPALILYTSGTTGRAKGALISHRGLVTFVHSAMFSGFRMMMLEMEAGKTVGDGSIPNCGLFSAPLFHLSGLFTGVIVGLAVGMKTVWTVGRFDPEQVLKLIQGEKVTTWASLGNMASRVLDHSRFGEYDVSTVTRIGSGGAPTSPLQQQRMTEGFTGTGGSMALGYGLTESTGCGTHNWGDLLARHPNSVGRVFPGIEISIRDDANSELPDKVEGEICIRGTCVMLEYWRKPDATAEALSSDRWLRTGDIGHFDGDFLYINTRARDLILRNAENIYPVEVEHCLQLHPEVVDAAVYGVPHDEWGQEIKATVVIADDIPLHAEALSAFCAEKLAAFKIPTQWTFQTEPLPRNAAGKVLKDVLAGHRANTLSEA